MRQIIGASVGVNIAAIVPEHFSISVIFCIKDDESIKAFKTD